MVYQKMTTREKLIQEINQSPDSVIEELLDFLLFIKSRRNRVEDEVISESAAESFRQGWYDVVNGNTLPVSELWEGIDAE
ncbi:hypothetical protein [Anabaena azotica]|uniref:hypothetical protein n=1 Tax=Anabaena azotica TaxID=197653 RepID=UPI0039A550CE